MTDAGRGNYWADTLSEDNEMRLAATGWMDITGPRGLSGCASCRNGLCPQCNTNHAAAASCPDTNGPTDQGIRDASLWWVQNVLPDSSGLGAPLMLGGRRAAGFGLAQQYAQPQGHVPPKPPPMQTPPQGNANAGATTTTGMSTGTKWAIGAGAAAVVVGGVLLMSRKRRRRRSR